MTEKSIGFSVNLKARMIGIVTEILGCDRETAEAKLEKANWVIRKAVED